MTIIYETGHCHHLRSACKQCSQITLWNGPWFTSCGFSGSIWLVERCFLVDNQHKTAKCCAVFTVPSENNSSHGNVCSVVTISMLYQHIASAQSCIITKLLLVISSYCKNYSLTIFIANLLYLSLNKSQFPLSDLKILTTGSETKLPFRQIQVSHVLIRISILRIHTG